jgi:hypothetical protein
MFARKLSIHLKPNTRDEFIKTLERDIVPLLRKQAGFQDEITFAIPGGTDVLAISLWDTRKNAEDYDNGIYQDVLAMLKSVIEGTPRLGSIEVLSSTFHKIRAGVAAA